MFRTFDEDNARAFAVQALGCRSSIRIKLNMIYDWIVNRLAQH
jgi:hypothetical protein